ncbi:hypothetical protein BN873_980055 [Candidatus Competibacter denitrificans Run_A_D11]|uniref:Uncharacterized protein n=1 Tax=Candidatus Competibacter denitrificans Run_A_D11 TaxID=1400863 RepID=W6MBQ3_9GAMM|nr:hypothetical protein [Candidatus Competibacter denitrificans]CDI04454.1 hypothetical protein BN873_980055 [Candidatus Competibacter denitrificans Run_A_D11]HAS85863.1 hypothetical protein [Candidatus Competibacteraceae bacterium]HRC69418.1 hypothetical protein [Candidatus Competibacter denitrificans]
MLRPAVYVKAYAKLSSWLWFNDDWNWTNTPIVMYLQNSGDRQTKANVVENAFWEKLTKANKGKSLRYLKTFNFDDYDYIPASIHRTFIGKACPWEIQETIQLGSSIGVINRDNVDKYCRDNIGVDCGGFVAAYWGEAVPHMAGPNPPMATGISPRSFWSDSKTWPDVIRRRRTDPTAIQPGDAAIFFEGVKGNNPDIMARKDSNGNWIKDSGSKAFHIGLVNDISASGTAITKLEIAESSGAPSIYGGNGVNVRTARVTSTGKSNSYVYAEVGQNERIYFLAPIPGAGPELPYGFSDE